MERRVGILLAIALLVAGRLGASGADSAPDPVLWRQVTIPESLLRTITNNARETVRFGGDVRLGDLDNDSKVICSSTDRSMAG